MLRIGLKNAKRLAITPAHTASAMGSGTLPVLATPALAALMEATAAESIEPYLEAGTTSVGTALNLAHVAADPVGVTVACESELVAIDGRRFTFHITASDRAGLVGEATHERVVVSSERFMQRTNLKREPENDGIPDVSKVEL